MIVNIIYYDETLSGTVNKRFPPGVDQSHLSMHKGAYHNSEFDRIDLGINILMLCR